MTKGQVVNKLKTENFSCFHLEIIKPGVALTNDRKRREWKVQPSEFAMKITNPIRAIVENLNVQPNPNKAFIPLSVGKKNNKLNTKKSFFSKNFFLSVQKFFYY